MKAMILAAGLGTRLKEITQTTPKCLVEAGGMTMLERTIRALKAADVDFVVVNLHYLSEKVVEFFSSNQFDEVSVNFSHEHDLLGTGGGIQHASRFFDDCDCFIVHNADVFSSIDLKAVVKRHREAGALATLVVMERRSSRTLLFDHSGQLVGWKTGDKVEPEGLSLDGLKERAFTGIQVISPGIFSYMAGETAPFSIISSYMKAASQGERILEYDATGSTWIDVGTVEKLEEFRSVIESSDNGPKNFS